MADERVDLILATGGPAVVAAAYRSGHPGDRRRPGQRARLRRRERRSCGGGAAHRRLEVVRQLDPLHQRVGGARARADRRPAARGLRGRRRRTFCTPEEAERLRGPLCRRGRLQRRGRARQGRRRRSPGSPGSKRRPGRSSSWRRSTASQPEEPLRAREALPGPRLRAGRRQRPGGRGRPRDDAPRRARPFGRLPLAATRQRSSPSPPRRRRSGSRSTCRCSQGAAGFGTHLGPTMTIGTGFAGGSAIGENLAPEHLVNWTQVAFATEAALQRDSRARALALAAAAAETAPIPSARAIRRRGPRTAQWRRRGGDSRQPPAATRAARRDPPAHPRRAARGSGAA